MIKKFKPKTPSLRHTALESHDQLTKYAKPEKSLTAKKNRVSGRNNNGHITCRHRGGGAKRTYRIIDFKRDKLEVPAKVDSIQYDPNRTAHIALLHYKDGEKRYIIAPEGLKSGDIVLSTVKEEQYDVGCCMPLRRMPLGSTVHNIETVPGKGGCLVRSAGLSAQLMAKSGGYATLKMPSGEIRLINEDCFATFGVVSNAERNLRHEGKAGRKRWQGIRPTVRGTAMNPVDHGLGGGEGKSKGHHPMSPWYVPAKGYKTRCKRKTRRFIVKDRRK